MGSCINSLRFEPAGEPTRQIYINAGFLSSSNDPSAITSQNMNRFCEVSAPGRLRINGLPPLPRGHSVRGIVSVIDQRRAFIGDAPTYLLAVPPLDVRASLRRRCFAAG